MPHCLMTLSTFREKIVMSNHVIDYTDKRLTRQKAIEAMCRECTYDELDEGTWRMQVEQCELSNCPLYQYRPRSRSKSNEKADSASVQQHYDPISVQVGGSPA